MNRKLKTNNHKLITIVGPTASGKSNLAVKLAKKFGGEIISADSRQIYKRMDIGTGKVPRDKSKIKNQILNIKNKKSNNGYFYKGVQHYLLDVASPKRIFTVAQYQKLALKAVKNIHKKNKVPILCGGSGFYIQSVVDGIVLPEVKPDWKLRKKLEKKSSVELFKILRKLDPKRAKNIDKHNPRRLIRAIEIVKKTKNPVPKIKSFPQFDTLIIGIKKSPKELKKLIANRLKKRLRQGMVNEVKKLRKSGLSWRRLEEFGLEYRWIAKYLRLSLRRRLSLRKLNYQEMTKKLQKDIEHFAKRQMTWFRGDKRINWIRNSWEAEKLIKNFLGK